MHLLIMTFTIANTITIHYMLDKNKVCPYIFLELTTVFFQNCCFNFYYYVFIFIIFGVDSLPPVWIVPKYSSAYGVEKMSFLRRNTFVGCKKRKEKKNRISSTRYLP